MRTTELTDDERTEILLLTAQNHHMEAHRRAAQIAGHNRAVKAYDAMIVLRDLEGAVDHHLYLIENMWRIRLYDFIKNGQGGIAGTQAYRCL